MNTGPTPVTRSNKESSIGDFLVANVFFESIIYKVENGVVGLVLKDQEEQDGYALRS